jgi:hypothetical protein
MTTIIFILAEAFFMALLLMIAYNAIKSKLNVSKRTENKPEVFISSVTMPDVRFNHRQQRVYINLRVNKDFCMFNKMASLLLSEDERNEVLKNIKVKEL